MVAILNYLYVPVIEMWRCSFAGIPCVCLSVYVLLVLNRSKFLMDLNDTLDKHSTGDREEPYCFVTL